MPAVWNHAPWGSGGANAMGQAVKGAGRAFVAYLRVSTDRQGKSGLGLEAQEAAIRAYLKPADRLLMHPFMEVESGRKADRPMLAQALAKCRKTGATLLVAKVDRLARNLPFLRSLI